MSTFLIDNETARDYDLENVLANRTTVVALVEDESDIPVWKEFLSSVRPDIRFRLSPFSSECNATKGKAGILKRAANFGPTMIGCVDSDYDWLLDRYMDDGLLIASNRYILQTFAYGIENLYSQPYNAAVCMATATCHDCEALDTLDEEYKDFLTRLSSIIYDPLLWHLTMIKTRTDDELVSDGWKQILAKAHYDQWVNDRTLGYADVRSHVLDEMQRRAEALISRYTVRYQALAEEKEHLGAELRATKSLSEVNAYLFASTHFIFDFLCHTFFKPMEGHLINAHKEEIKSRCELRHRTELLNHYEKTRVGFEKLRRSRFDFLHDPTNPITAAIKSDINTCFMRQPV